MGKQQYHKQSSEIKKIYATNFSNIKNKCRGGEKRMTLGGLELETLTFLAVAFVTIRVLIKDYIINK